MKGPVGPQIDTTFITQNINSDVRRKMSLLRKGDNSLGYFFDNIAVRDSDEHLLSLTITRIYRLLHTMVREMQANSNKTDFG